LPKAFLQHGSIILENRFPADQPTAALANLLPAPPSSAELERLLTAELAAKLDAAFITRDFTPQEQEMKESLVAKYAGPEWTIHRRA
jgi:hypothetical protein